jgi:ParB family chromosome partitioning protein
MGRQPESFVLIAGERRLRAAKLAGLDRVPIVIKDVSPQALLELALVENLVRSDLSPLEEAQAYLQLSQEFGLTHEAIATRVGRSRASVSNTLRLLTLPDEIKIALASGTVSEGHARALLSLPSAIDQVAALKDVLAKHLSVRQTEELVRKWQSNQSGPGIRRVPVDDRYSWSVAERLQRSLGTKVAVKRDMATGQGSISIHFFDDEQLSALLERLGLVDDF